MDHVKDVRRVFVIPIREKWHATPLFNDGTAGDTQRFTEVSAAWDWAVTIHPGVPVTVHTGRRARRGREEAPMLRKPKPHS